MLLPTIASIGRSDTCSHATSMSFPSYDSVRPARSPFLQHVLTLRPAPYVRVPIGAPLRPESLGLWMPPVFCAAICSPYTPWASYRTPSLHPFPTTIHGERCLHPNILRFCVPSVSACTRFPRLPTGPFFHLHSTTS